MAESITPAGMMMSGGDGLFGGGGGLIGGLILGSLFATTEIYLAATATLRLPELSYAALLSKHKPIWI